MNLFQSYLRNVNVEKLVNSRFKKPSRIIGVMLVILSFAFTIYKMIKDWNQIQQFSWNLDLRYLLIGFGLYSVNLLLTASCWALIVGFFTRRRCFWNHVRIFCLTNVVQRLPTPLPYVTARTEAYVRQNLPRSTILVSMTAEVMIILYSALVVAFLTIPFVQAVYEPIAVITLGILLAPLSGVLFFPKTFIRIANVILSRLNYSPLPITLDVRHILVLLAIFLFIWINSGVIHYVLISSLFVLPSKNLLVLINISAISGVIGWMSQMLFFLPTPAIRQLTMIYFLNMYFPMPLAVASALFVRISIMVFELIWASIFLMVPIREGFACKQGDYQ